MTSQPTDTQVTRPEIAWQDHPVVMGVLNVTPDSFSDGGRYTDVDAAVEHGMALRRAGADIVDIGGESTRPGAERVDAATEVARVVPVITGLVAAGVPVSIDTTRAAVAAAALAAGAVVINDVSGGLADPAMAGLAAEAGCPWILMHWRGHSRHMSELAVYQDVVTEVRDELRERVHTAVAAGVAPGQIILDPGLGFAKTAEHNWALSAHLDVLIALGFPVLFGASRKTYLGRLLAGADGQPRPVAEREAATLATSVLAAAAGAWGVRVHDVRGTADALAVWRAAGRPRMSEARPGEVRPAETRLGKMRPAETRPGETRSAGTGPGETRSAGTGPGATRPGEARPGEARPGETRPDEATRGKRPVTGQITLSGLRVKGHHGVYDFEREAGQDFVVDVRLDLDLERAAASDDVADTVHYGELAEKLVAVIGGEPVDLIETLAGRLLDVCLADDRVGTAEVTVHKPQAPIRHEFADVAVTLRRGRS